VGSADIEGLLKDLCAHCGYSMAVREPESFIARFNQGPQAFTDAARGGECGP
jgi:hypothetical protein